jgi:hypothetical protein
MTEVLAKIILQENFFKKMKTSLLGQFEEMGGCL